MSNYRNELKELSNLPAKQLKKYIRKKAVSKTRERLTKNGKEIKDLSWEELQELVADEEKSVVSELKSKGLIATSAVLALNLLNPVSIIKGLFFDDDDLDEFDEEETDQSNQENDSEKI